ncbi:WD40/YVTN/BNR-like repeat-containing protein [Salinicoccus sp. HZC-1]|uniref:WD40/YVTN/BNR-like repeat-containing protein n=1 Tax=Salinicoccus sp. HZC-1 TaxID=3385497 RepID=UPI00398B7D59
MVKTLYFSAGSSVYEIKKADRKWIMQEKSVPNVLLCLAADPDNPGRLYGGTFDDGLFISDDNGETWKPSGSGITHNRVMSIAVSPTEVGNGYRIVWAGTEPSGLFRSEDGGQTWMECPALLDLPSKSSWSFPPRPETHHVRWIEPDRHDENRIFVGIELGGVMKSEDRGETWEIENRSLNMTAIL